MRVGVNTLFLIPEEVGGSETYVRSLLRALDSLDDDLALVVFTNDENHASFSAFDRVHVSVQARSRLRRIWAEQTCLVKEAQKVGIDLLFSPGYTAPLRAPFPQVVTVHDVQYRAMPEAFPWWWRQANRFLVGRAAKNADIILTGSEFSRREIVKYYGVASEKVVLTPYAPTRLGEPREPALDKPFLLYVANTYEHKNAVRLLSAYTSIAERIPHDLVIVGQPRSGEPPPHPRLRRFHRVTDAELAGLYGSCALFVFPSRYEGFGLPVVEAMALGARVVASRIGAVTEVAGDAATYFDPGNEADMAKAIEEALAEPPEKRAQHIETGMRRAQRFTWEECARRTLGAFEAVVTRRAS